MTEGSEKKLFQNIFCGSALWKKVPDFTDCFPVFGTLCDLQNLDKQYTRYLKDRQCSLGYPHKRFFRVQGLRVFRVCEFLTLLYYIFSVLAHFYLRKCFGLSQRARVFGCIKYACIFSIHIHFLRLHPVSRCIKT